VELFVLDISQTTNKSVQIMVMFHFFACYLAVFERLCEHLLLGVIWRDTLPLVTAGAVLTAELHIIFFPGSKSLNLNGKWSKKIVLWNLHTGQK